MIIVIFCHIYDENYSFQQLYIYFWQNKNEKYIISSNKIQIQV